MKGQIDSHSILFHNGYVGFSGLIIEKNCPPESGAGIKIASSTRRCSRLCIRAFLQRPEFKGDITAQW
jgi:hypothetical protein